MINPRVFLSLLNVKSLKNVVKNVKPARRTLRNRFHIPRRYNQTLMTLISRVAAVGALLTTALMAQGPFGELTSSTPPDPATMVANQVARLTRLLTLTTAQAAQATTIFTNSLTAITPLETTLNTDRDSLHAAVKANATSTIDSLSAAIGTLHGQILAIQSKADAAFYAILTADQQTILNSRGGFGGRPGPRGRQ